METLKIQTGREVRPGISMAKTAVETVIEQGEKLIENED